MRPVQVGLPGADSTTEPLPGQPAREEAGRQQAFTKFYPKCQLTLPILVLISIMAVLWSPQHRPGSLSVSLTEQRTRPRLRQSSGSS